MNLPGLIVLCLFPLATAQASILSWSAGLDESQELPSGTGSPATGFGTVEFDDVTNVLSISLAWENLTSTATQSHIHCCVPPTGSVGIALDLWLAADPRPVSGNYFNQWDLDLVDPFRATFETGSTVLEKFAVLAAAMNTQSAYFNIHTVNFPPGEIRGNISAALVPEPGTFGLLLSCVAALVAVRRGIRR